MRKILFFGMLLILLSLGVSYLCNSKNSSYLSSLTLKNLEALAMNEGSNEGGGESGNGNNNPRKLTVCVCTDYPQSSVDKGYYNFSDMKNHCHDGYGNDCTGKVYNCQEPKAWKKCFP